MRFTRISGDIYRRDCYKMKKQPPAWLALLVIALAAGLLLGLTNEITADKIKDQADAAAAAARQAVLQADAFEELNVAEGASVDNCFAGKTGGNIVGYVCQITVKGYGGAIELTVGMDTAGTVTGLSVGGSSFAETAGLGARSKEPEFTDQFKGVVAPLELRKGDASGNNQVDAITAATITSTAVVNGVNAAAEYMSSLMAN